VGDKFRSIRKRGRNKNGSENGLDESAAEDMYRNSALRKLKGIPYAINIEDSGAIIAIVTLSSGSSSSTLSSIPDK
jgi:hypothetical protein